MKFFPHKLKIALWFLLILPSGAVRAARLAWWSSMRASSPATSGWSIAAASCRVSRMASVASHRRRAAIDVVVDDALVAAQVPVGASRLERRHHVGRGAFRRHQPPVHAIRDVDSGLLQSGHVRDLGSAHWVGIIVTTRTACASHTGCSLTALPHLRRFRSAPSQHRPLLLSG